MDIDSCLRLSPIIGVYCVLNLRCNYSSILEEESMDIDSYMRLSPIMGAYWVLNLGCNYFSILEKESVDIELQLFARDYLPSLVCVCVSLCVHKWGESEIYMLTVIPLRLIMVLLAFLLWWRITWASWGTKCPA